jgi:hypothetical protein
VLIQNWPRFVRTTSGTRVFTPQDVAEGALHGYTILRARFTPKYDRAFRRAFDRVVAQMTTDGMTRPDGALAPRGA